MDAVVWGDPICPWCYVGQRRTDLLRRLGVGVTQLPYQLHPEIPPGGVPFVARAGGRIAAVYAGLAALADAEGLAFKLPTRTPNTARALATVEVVRAVDPVAADALWTALFDAHFASGLDIGDPGVLARLVDGITGAGAAVTAEVDDGAGRRAVEAFREEAHDAGVAGAPAWHIDGRLLVAGLQDPEWFERVVARMQRTATA